MPKYAETKAANQATKEDIGEITAIVEKIKSDLLQQNELLKVQLSFTHQHKMNLKTAERDAIFEYNRGVNAWLLGLMNFSFTHYDGDNYKELNKVFLDTAMRKYACDVAEAHVVLFMHDKEFITLKRDFHVSIIELESIIDTAILSYIHAYGKNELAIKHAQDPNKQYELQMSIYDTLKEISSDFNANRIKKFEECNKLSFRMTTLIHQRLKALEQSLPGSSILTS